MQTPWGKSDSIEDIGNGILAVTTPSHGGYYVPLVLWATMPEPYQKTFAGGTWYEEDCDWAKVVLSFPKLFSPEEYQGAISTAKHYFPEDYDAVNSGYAEFRKTHA